MTTDPGCSDVRLLLPELALGTLAGQERARALDHVGSCTGCRRELQSLVELGDQLLLLGPLAEPPVGFESRVLERLSGGGKGRRSRRWVGVAAALLIAALVGAGAVHLSGREDRELAAGYRSTLGVADGRYIAARPLVGRGHEVGYVFGYQGSPPWIFCVVRAGSDAVYDIEITGGGDTRIVGEMQVHGGRGAWHQILEMDLHDLRRVRLLERATGEAFVATW